MCDGNAAKIKPAQEKDKTATDALLDAVRGLQTWSDAVTRDESALEGVPTEEREDLAAELFGYSAWTLWGRFAGPKGEPLEVSFDNFAKWMPPPRAAMRPVVIRCI